MYNYLSNIPLGDRQCPFTDSTTDGQEFFELTLDTECSASMLPGEEHACVAAEAEDGYGMVYTVHMDGRVRFPCEFDRLAFVWPDKAESKAVIWECDVDQRGEVCKDQEPDFIPP